MEKEPEQFYPDEQDFIDYDEVPKYRLWQGDKENYVARSNQRWISLKEQESEDKRNIQKEIWRKQLEEELAEVKRRFEAGEPIIYSEIAKPWRMIS